MKIMSILLQILLICAKTSLNLNFEEKLLLIGSVDTF